MCSSDLGKKGGIVQSARLIQQQGRTSDGRELYLGNTPCKQDPTQCFVRSRYAERYMDGLMVKFFGIEGRTELFEEGVKCFLVQTDFHLVSIGR